jgi:predicted glycoside hydrolase/deacetylase ChbG (UPF0249 family)
MLPGILSVAQGLGAHHGIKPMRLPQESISPYMLTKPGGFPRIAQQLVLNHFCRKAQNSFGPHTDHFVGFFYGGKLDTKALLNVVSNLPKTGTCELMCHPGKEDPTSDKLHWRYEWAHELSALKSASIAQEIETRRIRLISFQDLTV